MIIFNTHEVASETIFSLEYYERLFINQNNTHVLFKLKNSNDIKVYSIEAKKKIFTFSLEETDEF